MVSDSSDSPPSPRLSSPIWWERVSSPVLVFNCLISDQASPCSLYGQLEVWPPCGPHPMANSVPPCHAQVENTICSVEFIILLRALCRAFASTVGFSGPVALAAMTFAASALRFFRGPEYKFSEASAAALRLVLAGIHATNHKQQRHLAIFT